MSVDHGAMDPGLTMEIVARIQEGDRKAWEALYERVHDELLFAGLRGKLESADILQSVVLECMGALPRFQDRGERSLRHFLHVLVTNKIRDRAATFAARKRRGTVALTDDLAAEQVSGPESRPSYRAPERYVRLERALERLPEDMREVILLRRVEGLTSKEAAEHMRRSDAAVRQLYSRAIARLTMLVGEG